MITISISDEVRSHIARHFNERELGSLFEHSSPEAFLIKAIAAFPDTFRLAKPDPDGRIRLSLQFQEPVGYSAVVALDDLTPEERSSIVVSERDGYPVGVLRSSRRIPTTEAQIILSSDYSLITLFPGPLAPPLPTSPSESCPFWKNHVFVESV